MIGGGEQAIAQKTGDLDGPYGFGDPRPNCRWPTREPTRVATRDRIRHVDEVSIDAESVEHLDHRGAAIVRMRDRGVPLGEQQRIDGVMNAAGERRLVASDRLAALLARKSRGPRVGEQRSSYGTRSITVPLLPNTQFNQCKQKPEECGRAVE